MSLGSSVLSPGGALFDYRVSYTHSYVISLNLAYVTTSFCHIWPFKFHLGVFTLAVSSKFLVGGNFIPRNFCLKLEKSKSKTLFWLYFGFDSVQK